MPQLVRESPESSEGEPTPKDSDLGELSELEPGVTSFLTGLPESSEEEGPPPEPPTGEFHEWVNWKAKMTDTPDWCYVGQYASMRLKSYKYILVCLGVIYCVL